MKHQNGKDSDVLHGGFSGNLNAFFGLMLDNIADLLLTVSLLSVVFGFPTDFALRYMVPGTAIGVLIGDLLFFWMAVSYAQKTGRDDVTAMPLGLDTPSTFGMVLLVLGPAFLQAKTQMSDFEAARHAWHIGICAIFISGVFKVGCAFGSHWIRRFVPRAGLLGSLAAIALVVISFLPLLEVLHYPVVGLLSLALVLTTLVARVRLPLGIPGALGALLIGGSLYYLLAMVGLIEPAARTLASPSVALLPHEWITVFRFEWISALGDTVKYLPVILPFALATVIGGIDCTESAAAAGDDFDTRQVIGVEALATLIASLCGGVLQTTPYIGHPAYKAMGGRAGYTLATALFVGGAGLLGFFGYMFVIIPKATVYPILIFVGLEITAQSFQATPKRHYPAVALACVPALAYLILVLVDRLLGDPALAQAGITTATLVDPSLRYDLQTIRMLSNGFIVTSLLWASGLATIIDRRLTTASLYFTTATALTLFGIIHSPLPGSPMFLPWNLPQAALENVLQYAGGYALVGAMLALWGSWSQMLRSDANASTS